MEDVNYLLFFASWNGNFTAIGHDDKTPVLPDETFDIPDIDKVGFVRADEIMMAQKLFIFLQGLGDKELFAVNKKELGVVVIRFAPDDIVDIDDMDLFGEDDEVSFIIK